MPQTSLEARALNRLSEVQQQQDSLDEEIAYRNEQLTQRTITYEQFLGFSQVIINKRYMLHGESRGLKLALGLD